jgi:hypothetical protein
VEYYTQKKLTGRGIIGIDGLMGSILVAHIFLELNGNLGE